MGFSDNEDFINLDLEEVDTGQEPMPAGQRVLNVVGVVKKQKEGSAHPYLEVTLKDDTSNKKAWLNLSFSPKALWNLKLFVQECGVKFTKQGFSISEMVGKKVSASVTIVPSFKDPSVPANEVGPPYHRVG